MPSDHQFHDLNLSIIAGLNFSRSEYFDHTGYEAMHMIRKGQIRWLPKGDTVGQVRFVNQIFGLAV